MIREIKARLNEKKVELKHKPLTGWTDFDSATSVFNNWRKSLVITGVDKAANCLCILCKACFSLYKQLQNKWKAQGTLCMVYMVITYIRVRINRVRSPVLLVVN